jgi:hypothetical protein
MKEDEMNRINLRAICFLIVLMLSLNLIAIAQEYSKPKASDTAKQSGMESRHNQSNQANAGQPATLMAKLVDAEKKAKEKAATVQVMVKGIALIDPAKVNERPRRGQGHLHYQVDNGPVIATTTTKLSFHELSLGEHRIVVMLAGNDHKPLGPQETLTVTVP